MSYSVLPHIIAGAGERDTLLRRVKKKMAEGTILYCLILRRFSV